MPLNQGSGLPAPWMQSKENKAITVIEEWLDSCSGNGYISVSGGKDSLVVAELAVLVKPDIPLVWVNQGELAEWEDSIELLQYWRSALGRNLIELCPPRSLWKLYEDYGLPLEETMNNKIDKAINQKLLYDPLDEWGELNRVEGYAMGIRAEESSGRKKRMKSYNTLHFNKGNQLWSCCPIGWWKVENVWQFIDRHRVLYPAFYDRDRKTVRNGCPIGTTGINRGRLADLRANHFEYWSKLIAKYPYLSAYC